MPEAPPSASAPALPAPAPGRVLFDRAFLDHLDRALLCRLLAPWSAALDAIRATAQGDRRLVEKLFDAAHHDAIPAAPFPADLRSLDMVDADLTLTQINGNTTERALVLFDKLSSGLAVQGWTSMKDALRRFVGVCFFGDAGHFGVGAVYSLEPLRHLDVALDPRGIPGLEGIALREIALVNPDNSIRSYPWSNGDLRGSNNDAEIRAALATKATIASVKLYLKIAGRTRPTAVTLTANRKKFLVARPTSSASSTSSSSRAASQASRWRTLAVCKSARGPSSKWQLLRDRCPLHSALEEREGRRRDERSHAGL